MSTTKSEKTTSRKRTGSAAADIENTGAVKVPGPAAEEKTAKTRKPRTVKKSAEDTAAAEKSTKTAAASAEPAKKTTTRRAGTAAKSESAAKTTAKRPATRKTAAKAPAPAVEEEKAAAATAEVAAETAPVNEKAPETVETAVETPAETVEAAAEAPVESAETPAETAETNETPADTTETPSEPAPDYNYSYSEPYYDTPRRSVAFIGSECYPFVKTGGLGDVMYALPKALVKQNCDVKVILPRYACIPWEYQQRMVYRGAFQMDLCADGRPYYVGIMEYVWDGVVYDFIDNDEFFGTGNPYTNLIDDIPRFCYFAKAALAALNYMDWIPNVIHCHDWQAALVPIYLRTAFGSTKLASAKVILTIHNLRFQGVYNIPTVKYWSGLPDYVFNKDALTVNWLDANMLKGGITYSNAVTTVSPNYAREIQTPEYGEGLDAHLRYHSGKLRGIVNGIDYDMWNTWTDSALAENYDITNVLERKPHNKLALQEELGLERDAGKFVIGLISRLTDQKGLDLVNSIIPQLMDGNTQIVLLGTGDRGYEDSFRYFENAYRGSVCSNIMYDEGRSHRIYAGADALLVPSRFEPCGLTQLNAMRYGTVPIVRETGGLKDTVEPYNMFANTGNGFTFDRYDAGLLLDAVNRAKTLYFTNRWCWDEMVQRNMDKDVSWDSSARQYKELYLQLT